MRKNPKGEEVFPVKQNGQEKMLSVSELENLKGGFRLVMKSGALKEGFDKTLTWSLSVTEIIINTTMEVADDPHSPCKFGKYISV